MNDQAAEIKQEQWAQLARKVATLSARGRRGLRSLSATELTELLNEYGAVTSDLARARSLGASAATVEYLNRIAVATHNLLYRSGRLTLAKTRGLEWTTAFARAVRQAPRAVMLAVFALFLPALISYWVVQIHPDLAFDLVPPEFYNFRPASNENLHDIPSITRPLVATSIISNNIQVTFLAFALGLTGGIGTSFVLIFNGVHLGSVAGWMTHHGQSRALWGWIMPHGGLELLAICLAGAGGYLLAEAQLAPGLSSRISALQRVAGQALTIEAGCMVLLLFAGLIEGNVSPSGIAYPTRIAILVSTLSLALLYLALAGRGNRQESQGESRL